jgi:hypothetical protein
MDDLERFRNGIFSTLNNIARAISSGDIAQADVPEARLAVEAMRAALQELNA